MFDEAVGPVPELNGLLASLRAPAGPELLAALQARPPSGLPTRALPGYLAAAERLSALAGAMATSAIAELDRRLEVRVDEEERMQQLLAEPDCDLAHEPAVAEVMALTRCSRRYALDRVRFARTLSDELPEVAAAWAAGEIGFAHARAIAESLGGEPAGVRTSVLPKALHSARIGSLARLRRTLRRALAAAAPQSLTREARVDRDERYLQVHRATGEIIGWLPPDQIALVDAALAGLAAPSGPDDRRNIDQRLADALVDVCGAHLSEATAGSPAVPAGTRVNIGVVTSAQALLGLTDTPGELLGYGPIPADATRRLACNGLFTRLLTDPASGRLLDLGRARRSPSAAQRRYVALRDQHCRFPGCGVPAWRCEPHHVDYWSRGGRTDRENLLLTCRRHHHLVHEGGWRIVGNCEQATTWLSPSGTRATTVPPPLTPPSTGPAPPAEPRPG